MKTNRLRKLMSFILVMSLASLGTVTVNSVSESDAESSDYQTYDEEIFVLPDIISESEAKEHGYIGRDYESEPNLYTFIFKNSDGTNTMKLFGHPVKYEDENGKVRDISLDIQENDDGSFSTVNNNIITTFSSDLTEGINIVYNDIDICMIPETGRKSIRADGSEDTDTVTYKLDDNTSYEYKLTYSGFKEDIVVTEYTGQTEFDFTLYTNGLKLAQQDDSYYLINEKGEHVASIGDIILNTADGRSDAAGSMTYRTVKENEEYVLTIHIDDEYLMDESTMYPIRIDPTITVNSGSGTSAIDDTTLFSLYNHPNVLSDYLFVGRHPTYGKARTVIRFPGLNLSSIHSSMNVLSANIELYDNLQQSESMSVLCYQFNGGWYNGVYVGGNWEEGDWTSSLDYWDSLMQDDDADIYTLLSANIINKSNGEDLNPQHRYSFNITQAVKRWVDAYNVTRPETNLFRPNRGVIFKALSSVENNTNSIKYKRFDSCTNNTGPSLTVIYTTTIARNLFYTKYNPDTYDDNYISNPSAYQFNNRLNCYGYAFGHILALENSINNIPYKQQPGEFTDVGNVNDVISYVKIRLINDTEVYMNNVISNMEKDAARLGYTITQYYPSSSIMEQFGGNSRLIAIVTGSVESVLLDYHFYVQHSDGTWSHKPGSTAVTNLSLNENESDKLILTNDNIYFYANKGIYETNGCLKFFIITKNGVRDYPHSNSCYSREYNTHDDSFIDYLYGIVGEDLDWPNCGHTNYLVSLSNYRECAGDFCENSKSLVSGIQTARFDYWHDHDVYCLTPTISKQYTLSLSGSGVAFKCKIFNKNGTLLYSLQGQDSLTVYFYMTAGYNYYIDVTCEASSYYNAVYAISYC